MQVFGKGGGIGERGVRGKGGVGGKGESVVMPIGYRPDLHYLVGNQANAQANKVEIKPCNPHNKLQQWICAEYPQYKGTH